jgi:hypothetical protein
MGNPQQMCYFNIKIWSGAPKRISTLKTEWLTVSRGEWLADYVSWLSHARTTVYKPWLPRDLLPDGLVLLPRTTKFIIGCRKLIERRSNLAPIKSVRTFKLIRAAAAPRYRYTTRRVGFHLETEPLHTGIAGNRTPRSTGWSVSCD